MAEFYCFFSFETVGFHSEQILMIQPVGHGRPLTACVPVSSAPALRPPERFRRGLRWGWPLASAAVRRQWRKVKMLSQPEWVPKKDPWAYLDQLLIRFFWGVEGPKVELP